MNEETKQGVRVYYSAANNIRHSDIPDAEKVERRPDGDWQVIAGTFKVLGIFDRSRFIGWHTVEIAVVDERSKEEQPA